MLLQVLQTAYDVDLLDVSDVCETLTGIFYHWSTALI